jgi:hypothetical protein
MSGVAEKTGERQKRVALMGAAFVIVGGLGVAIGRSSKTEPEPTAAASPSPSSYSSSSSPSPAPVPSAQLARQAPQAPWSSPDAGLQSSYWQTTEDPNWRVGLPQRDMDKDIFAKLKDPALERTALPDLFPDRPYKVQVFGSITEHRFGILMIDLKRDGTWDEKWDLMKPGEVARHVEHDESAGGQPVTYTLVHGKWQPH